VRIGNGESAQKDGIAERKTAVQAPMPKASESTAIKEKPGDFASWRTA